MALALQKSPIEYRPNDSFGEVEVNPDFVFRRSNSPDMQNQNFEIRDWIFGVLHSKKRILNIEPMNIEY